MVRKTAEILLQATQNGYDLSVSDAVRMVQDDYYSSIREIFNAHDDIDAIINALGEEKLKKIRERDLKQLKNPVPSQKPVQSQSKTEPRKKFDSPEAYKQWMREKLR
jgi:uncharacterized protein YdaL